MGAGSVVDWEAKIPQRIMTKNALQSHSLEKETLEATVTLFIPITKIQVELKCMLA